MVTQAEPDMADETKGTADPMSDVHSVNSDDLPDQDAQAGLKNIEAITAVWSRKSLVLAYVLIYLVFAMNALQQSITGQLTVYVYSDFSLAALIPVTNILSSILGALVKLPTAKVLDVWGRSEGFALMVASCTLGLVMMAACQNVETYCAAQVFYWIGFDGIGYVLDVFIADTSSLKNRALMFAFSTSPYFFTTWAGGPAAQSFLNGAGWRWAFATFAIVVPVVSLPLIILFKVNYNKAVQAGLIVEHKSGRTAWQTTKFYFIEFDVVGILLLAGGLALFLLPFSLYTYQALGWRSPMIISMIVIGTALIVVFILYEKFLAPVTFVPYALLTDRTVLGACVLAGTFFVSFYCWDAYFSPFLQTVQNLAVWQAAYVGNIYNIGSSFSAILVGLLIRLSGRFKWVALYLGLPAQILGIGLMIYFRQPDVNLGYVVMCQFFIAFGGGAIVICEQMAAMAASKHANIATVLAILSLFTSIGGAIGSTISTAIWTGVFPKALAEYLPADVAAANLTTIYESLPAQLAYPIGSPARTAIDRAYGDGQRYMCIAGTAVLAVAVAATMAWRDLKVKDFKQTKGTVV